LKKPFSRSPKTRRAHSEKASQTSTSKASPAVVRTKARVRPTLLISGIALIVAAALGAGLLTSLSQSSDGKVLITTTSVGAGKELSARVLTATRMQVPEGVTAYTPSDLETIIQMLAASELTPGTVLTTSNVTAERVVPTGKTVVGIPLEVGRMPGVRLVAGDPVRLVEVPDKTTVIVSSSSLSFKAVVFSVDIPDASAMVAVTIVNVVVDQADANELAGLAAAGRLALVIDSIAKK
jgi:hypothetical protein